MTETREERAERVYAEAERSLEVINARRVRRGPEVAGPVLGGVVGLMIAAFFIEEFLSQLRYRIALLRRALKLHGEITSQKSS